jgi:hypothetical protein
VSEKRLIVYLDQNKWIQLARLEHGLDDTENDLDILSQVRLKLSSGHLFPVSSYHLMEFARIRDVERRRKLGSIMWKYSNGLSVSSPHEIVSYEIEAALRKLGFDIVVRNFRYLKKGFSQTLGVDFDSLGIPNSYSEIIDKAILCGQEDIPPIHGIPNTFRDNFMDSQKQIQTNSDEFDKHEMENYLYALCMRDITSPLKKILKLHKLDDLNFRDWNDYELKSFVDNIPYLRVQKHLFGQLIKNRSQIPKPSDLEDWSGLGTAVNYCNLVVCEKHFANTIVRDGFETFARVETGL